MTEDDWRIVAALWRQAERAGRDATAHVDLLPDMIRLAEQEADRLAILSVALMHFQGSA